MDGADHDGLPYLVGVCIARSAARFPQTWWHLLLSDDEQWRDHADCIAYDLDLEVAGVLADLRSYARQGAAQPVLFVEGDGGSPEPADFEACLGDLEQRLQDDPVRLVRHLARYRIAPHAFAALAVPSWWATVSRSARVSRLPPDLVPRGEAAPDAEAPFPAPANPVSCRMLALGMLRVVTAERSLSAEGADLDALLDEPFDLDRDLDIAAGRLCDAVEEVARQAPQLPVPDLDALRRDVGTARGDHARLLAALDRYDLDPEVLPRLWSNAVVPCREAVAAFRAEGLGRTPPRPPVPAGSAGKRLEAALEVGYDFDLAPDATAAEGERRIAAYLGISQAALRKALRRAGLGLEDLARPGPTAPATEAPPAAPPSFFTLFPHAHVYAPLDTLLVLAMSARGDQGLVHLLTAAYGPLSARPVSRPLSDLPRHEVFSRVGCEFLAPATARLLRILRHLARLHELDGDIFPAPVLFELDAPDTGPHLRPVDLEDVKADDLLVPGRRHFVDLAVYGFAFSPLLVARTRRLRNPVDRDRWYATLCNALGRLSPPAGFDLERDARFFQELRALHERLLLVCGASLGTLPKLSVDTLLVARLPQLLRHARIGDLPKRAFASLGVLTEASPNTIKAQLDKLRHHYPELS